MEKWKADNLKSLTKRSEGLSIKNILLAKQESEIRVCIYGKR